MIYSNYIAGEWQAPGESGTFPVVNPATGEVFAEVASATADDVRRAIDGAEAARAGWANVLEWRVWLLSVPGPALKCATC